MEINGINGIHFKILENHRIKIKILPDYGGKIISIINKENKSEILFQNFKILKTPTYGSIFSEYDSSGFDECFPSIDECIYPEGNRKGLKIPDHGEVWTMPWKVEIKGKKAYLEVTSEKFQYTLKKTINLVDNKIKIDYQVINFGSDDLAYIWAPHMLLNCDENTKIVVPNHLDKVISLESSSTHLEYMKEYNYPYTIDKNNEIFDLSMVEKLDKNNCEKFYFLEQTSWSKIINLKTNESVIVRVPVDKVPYLGVWRTQGGYRGDYNIALEPCTGIYDSVEDGIKRNKIQRVKKKTSNTWWLELELK
ncbi:DUF5107 domain-containing protein [Psychrilyobacter sp.]|uniref:aldose epimerase family protein n=1 Tax=Psychrilyobacter sp. TaxID=2586924 RepID=UPI003017CA6B